MIPTHLLKERREAFVSQALSALEIGAGLSTDSETFVRLLSVAGRAVQDPSVLNRWIEVALTQTDSYLKECMIVKTLGADPRQIQNPQAWAALLLQGVSIDRLRPACLNQLGKLVTTYPAAASLLIQLYSEQRSRFAQRDILTSLCEWELPPTEFIPFFLSALETVDIDLKEKLIERLLKKNALPLQSMMRWLRGAEPSKIKELIFLHVIDRGIPLRAGARHVLREEPEATVRVLAVWVLGIAGGLGPVAVDVLLQTLDKDTDARVRAAALEAMQQIVNPSDTVLQKLLARLALESREDIFKFLLTLLSPHLVRRPAVQQTLMALLDQNLNPALATMLHQAMGRLLRADPSMLDAWLARYATTAHDSVRITMLQTLVSAGLDEARLPAFYAEGVQSPNAKIREESARGLLALSMTPGNLGFIEKGCPLILGGPLDRFLTVSLARRMTHIPNPSAELKSEIRKIFQQTDDFSVRRICETALSLWAPESAGTTAATDFDAWLKQLTVQHNASNIFPAIYLSWSENPTKATEVLKASMIVSDPILAQSLYQARVDSLDILRFLSVHGAIDEEIAHFAIDRLVRHPSGTPAQWLAYLRSWKELPRFTDGLWKLFTSASTIRTLNAGLLCEVFSMAYQGEKNFAEAFISRYAAIPDAQSATPYVIFMAHMAGWDLLRSTILDAWGRWKKEPALFEWVKEASSQLREKDAPLPDGSIVIKKKGPGLADE